MSSADGSPWSVNQLKNVFCSIARFLPFPTFLSLPFLVKSFPSFHRIGVLWEAGSPTKEKKKKMKPYSCQALSLSTVNTTSTLVYYPCNNCHQMQLLLVHMTANHFKQHSVTCASYADLTNPFTYRVSHTLPNFL